MPGRYTITVLFLYLLPIFQRKRKGKGKKIGRREGTGMMVSQDEASVGPHVPSFSNRDLLEKGMKRKKRGTNSRHQARGPGTIILISLPASSLFSPFQLA